MNDIINGGFEVAAAFFILNHCKILYRDKIVRGVSLLSTVFFFIWGVWNVYYYPSLGQTVSFYGGIAVCMANSVWVGLMVYYKRLENRPKGHEEW